MHPMMNLATRPMDGGSDSNRRNGLERRVQILETAVVELYGKANMADQTSEQNRAAIEALAATMTTNIDEIKADIDGLKAGGTIKVGMTQADVDASVAVLTTISDRLASLNAETVAVVPNPEMFRRNQNLGRR